VWLWLQGVHEPILTAVNLSRSAVKFFKVMVVVVVVMMMMMMMMIEGGGGTDLTAAQRHG
jgi:hypothetical protein